MKKSKYFDEGYTAYGSGLNYNDNPHHPDTIEGDEWLDGWTAAQLEDEKGNDWYVD